MTQESSIPSSGFVYILLNPSFPRELKIGRSKYESRHRAKELSRQTGVPHDFIVIYDEFVGDAEEVERLMHEKFAEYRIHRNKEFFNVAPKTAILALQQLGAQFPAKPEQPVFSVDLLEDIRNRFPDYLDPKITNIRLLQSPGACYLEITRTDRKKSTTSREHLPLWGIEEPPVATKATAEANAERLKALDEYSWIMISNLFPGEKAEKIAKEWEQPGGKLEQVNRHRS